MDLNLVNLIVVGGNNLAIFNSVPLLLDGDDPVVVVLALEVYEVHTLYF